MSSHHRRGPRRSEPSHAYTPPPQLAGNKRRHSDNFQGQRKRPRTDRTDPGLHVHRPLPYNVQARETEEDVPGIVIAYRGFPEGNVPTKLQFQEVLEDAYQGLVDPRGRVFNFDVSLREPKDGYPAVAFVTLPYADMKDALYDNHIFIFWQDTQLFMQRTDPRPPDPILLDELRRSDYTPVADALEREQLARELQQPITLSNLAFGTWVAEKQTFSPEYKVQTEALDESMSIYYNSDRRALILEKDTVQVDLDAYRTHKSRLMVVIHSHEIRRVLAYNNSILFHMHSPVHYELEEPTGTTRNFSYDFDQERVAPFTSSFVLITFPTAIAYQGFMQRMRKAPHFPEIAMRRINVRELKVYEQRHLDCLQRWYKTIPLSIALQCEQAIHSGVLAPLEILNLKEMVAATLAGSGKEVAVAAMQEVIVYFADQDPMTRRMSISIVEEKFREGKSRALIMAAAMRPAQDTNNFACHQLYMTPTSYILEGPYVDRSNRVLREYPDHHDHFLRVSFTEEGGQNRRLSKGFGTNVDFKDFIDRRIGDTLNKGFDLAGHHWEWLAYSQSALKDAQMIFVAPFWDEGKHYIDAERIREDIGLFRESEVIFQPAKYGARIAQAFSATSSSITISDDEWMLVPDIVRNGQCFTDGAGDMSLEMAKLIWSKLSHRRLHDPDPPSAFQARFAGCKGVWMVNPELSGRILRCSDSQNKFPSPSRTFDVANHSLRPGITFLNRPLVKLLEDLDIPKSTFLKIQRKTVDQIELAVESFDKAAVHFAKNNLGLPLQLARLYDNLQTLLGIDYDASPHGHIDFYKSVTMLGITAVLRDIKYKARIQVAGPTLIGVCDVWGFLEEGQIYVKVKGERTSRILLGQVAVTRSPVIHPGDVQLANAVAVPFDHPLATLVNVVVFSSKGQRPLPSMLGGGDLDGDLFNVITDPDLIPERTEAPGSYTADKPWKLERHSEMKDVAQFVCNYIHSDVVGQIASRHLIIADYSSIGVRDERCLKLAELAGRAVDFVKSGVPVDQWEIPGKYNRRFTPDFMAREDATDVYKSSKALGEMFRAVPIQKYHRPTGETQNHVDASVLHKILTAVETNYRQLALKQWDRPRSAFVWKAYAITFCAECEKLAFRNSLSRRDNHKLGEEELAVGTTGSLRVENGEMDMMHRARTQMSELVRRMRVFIKDMREGDVDIEEERVDLEEDGQGNTVIVKKEEVVDDDSSLLAKLAGNEVKNERMDSDEEVEVLVKPDVTTLDGEEDDDEIQETRRPDWRILAAGRAYGACVHAQDVLNHRTKVPFGMRLFSLVAVDTLLALIKNMS